MAGGASAEVVKWLEQTAAQCDAAYLREFLAEIFGRRVDFTTRHALHRDLKGRIIPSAIKVFDNESLDSIAAQ